MIAILIALLSPAALGWYARRVERGEGSNEEKVHRIQRASLAGLVPFLVMCVVAIPELRAEGVIQPRHGGHGTPPFVLPLILFVVFAIEMAGLMAAVQPVRARLRGVESRPGQALGRALRLSAVMMLPGVLWVAALPLVMSLAGHRPVVFVAALGVWTTLFVLISPLLMRMALKTRRMDPERRERLLALCREQGVRVADVRILDTGAERLGNAMASGVLPRWRYVLISDRLLDDLDSEELAAVLSHEVAHIRKRHQLLKVGCYIGCIAVLTLALAALRAAGLPHGVTSVLSLLAVPSIFVVQGLVGIRLERAADDYAARTVSKEALRGGLEKLAKANAMRRRTGLLWNVFQQHPGMDQRLRRLSAGSGAATS